MGYSGTHISVCSVRSKVDAADIQAEVAELPGNYVPLILDVTDASAVKDAVVKVDAMLEGAKLGALINNAGQTLLSYGLSGLLDMGACS